MLKEIYMYIKLWQILGMVVHYKLSIHSKEKEIYNNGL